MLAHEGPGWPVSPVPTARLSVSPPLTDKPHHPHTLTHPPPTLPTLPHTYTHTLKIIQSGLPLTNMTDKSSGLTLSPLVNPPAGDEGRRERGGHGAQ